MNQDVYIAIGYNHGEGPFDPVGDDIIGVRYTESEAVTLADDPNSWNHKYDFVRVEKWNPAGRIVRVYKREL